MHSGISEPSLSGLLAALCLSQGPSICSLSAHQKVVVSLHRGHTKTERSPSRERPRGVPRRSILPSAPAGTETVSWLAKMICGKKPNSTTCKNCEAGMFIPVPGAYEIDFYSVSSHLKRNPNKQKPNQTTTKKTVCVLVCVHFLWSCV